MFSLELSENVFHVERLAFGNSLMTHSTPSLHIIFSFSAKTLMITMIMITMTILRMSMLKWRTILMMIRGARAEINTFMFHEIDKLVYRVDALF